jgi:hypothetical protein
VPEIADDVVGVDTAMKLGYNWKFGPFELIDKIGAAKLAERLAAEGRPVPALLTLAEIAVSTAWKMANGSILDWMAIITMSSGPKVSCCSRTSSSPRSR